MMFLTFQSIGNPGEVHVDTLQRFFPEVFLVHIEHCIPLSCRIHCAICARMHVCRIQAGIDSKFFADDENFFQCSKLRGLPHGFQCQIHGGEELLFLFHDVINCSPHIVESLRGLHAEVKRCMDANGASSCNLSHSECLEDTALTRNQLLFLGCIEI